MTLVIDANIAVKWFIRQPDSQLARDLRAVDVRLIAPDLVIAEVANTLWRYTKTREITPDRAVEAIATLPIMLREVVPVEVLAVPALQLAYALDSAVYDCLYAVLALERKCGFVTAHRKFAERLRASRRLSGVKLLADFAP